MTRKGAQGVVTFRDVNGTFVDEGRAASRSHLFLIQEKKIKNKETFLLFAKNIMTNKLNAYLDEKLSNINSQHENN